MASIQHFYDSRTSTLSYVAWDPNSRDAVVIDPVLDFEPRASRTFTESVDAIAAFVQTQQLKVHGVLETHAHADHISAAPILKRRFGACIAIGAHICEVQTRFKSVFNLPAEFATDGRQFDRLLSDGEVFDAGTLSVHVLATPGHTPACLTYRIDDAIFTGDALFMDDYGTGRCDFPGGSASDLYDSVQRLYRLPPSTRVFPAHDYCPGGRALRWESSIEKQRAQNPQINAETTREAFVAFRETRDKALATPALFMQSVQLNVNAGRLPPAAPNGHQYLQVPLNLMHPADEFGEPENKG